MKSILLRIESVLIAFVEHSMQHHRKMQKATKKKRWLDAATAKFMLGIGDRMLYNYVKRGDLICEKRGNANVYLESSILKLLKKPGR